MTAIPDGNEGFSEEDRSYLGSRFSVVQEALFSNPYQKSWGRRRGICDADLQGYARSPIL
jgi:hypothetical protein